MLTNKKILITGGTGFFGKSIYDFAAKNKIQCEFTALSRHGNNMSNFKQILGDIRNFAFPDENFDIVIHAATPAETGLAAGEHQSIIIKGMERIIQFAQTKRCEKILFISSGAVYGQADSALAETHSLNPSTEYGVAKKDAEKMLLESGVPCVIARCFAFAGKHLPLNKHFAIGNFVKDALDKKAITINGDGRTVRSYMHTDDLCKWLFTLIEKAENNSIYNVGSPYPLTIKELAETVARLLNPASEIKILGTPSKPVSIYYPDTSKIYNDFGLIQEHTLSDCILDMAKTKNNGRLKN